MSGNSTCLKKCPGNQYGDEKTMKCKTCPEGCTNCTNNATCGGCTKGFMMNQSPAKSMTGSNASTQPKVCVSCNEYLTKAMTNISSTSSN